MKHRKFKLLLAMAMLVFALLVVVGCRGDETPAQAPTTPAPAPATPTPQPDPQEPEEEEEPEPLHLTIHYHVGHSVFNEEWPAWQQAFAATNVWLTGTANPVATDGAEQFNLEAANQFPAHIYGGQSLMPQFKEFGMQGAFVALTDLIPVYAPNFYALMNQRPEIRAAITAPDGNIYHFPTLPDGLQEGARTWFIRQDWLDLLGLDVPNTVQELEDVMIAFRDEIPALIGVDRVWPYIDGNWHNVLRLANLWGARAYGNDNHAVRVAPREDSNEIYHTWTDPQFMYALQNISRWYGMGLIDESFITRGSGARNELLTQNAAGVIMDFPLSTAAFNDSAAIRDVIPDLSLLPMAPPINSLGRRMSEHERLPVQPHGWAISHTNPDPARTVQFMDFFYSEPGRALLSYGAEGYSWEFDSEGVRRFLPRVFEQTVQPDPTNYLRHEMGALRFLGYQQIFDYEREMANLQANMAFDINREGGPSWAVRQLPVLSFTADELQTINSIQPALNTFLNENIQRMILEDYTLIEAGWDAFVQQAIQLGRDELVAAYQSAFNRAFGF